jgi:Flp pilus assembly protein TadG
MSKKSIKARNTLRRFVARENGTQIIEFAIIFPVLFLLIAGVVEIGRLFNTYTTLAKATRAGSRFLSSNRGFRNNPNDKDPAKAQAYAQALADVKNLVLCGNVGGCCNPQTDANKCTDAGEFPPVVDKLTTANLVIPQITKAGGVDYVSVAIKDYTFSPLIFDLNAMTGGTAFTISLQPKNTMRYLPDN